MTRFRVGGNGFVWDSETGKWVLGDFEGKYINQGAPVVGVRSLASGDNDFAPVDISDLLHDDLGSLIVQPGIVVGVAVAEGHSIGAVAVSQLDAAIVVAGPGLLAPMSPPLLPTT